MGIYLEYIITHTIYNLDMTWTSFIAVVMSIILYIAGTTYEDK